MAKTSICSGKILKADWGFDGFVLSDWIFGTQTTLGSALNGLDLEMPIASVYGEVAPQKQWRTETSRNR